MTMNSDYVSRMETQLKEWDDGVDALADESEQASPDARAAYHGRIMELRACRDAAQKSFREIRVANEAAGAQLQVAMQATWERMKETLDKVSAEFRK